MRSLFLTAAEAAAVRDRFGTPCYVYDRAVLESAAARALAFPHAFGVTVRYAMKANPNRALLEIFRDRGLHIDASSDFEVERALRAGFSPERIMLPSQGRRGAWRNSYRKGSSTTPARFISSSDSAARFRGVK